jgi:hypothetical protein
LIPVHLLYKLSNNMHSLTTLHIQHRVKFTKQRTRWQQPYGFPRPYLGSQPILVDRLKNGFWYRSLIYYKHNIKPTCAIYETKNSPTTLQISRPYLGSQPILVDRLKNGFWYRSLIYLERIYMVVHWEWPITALPSEIHFNSILYSI